MCLEQIKNGETEEATEKCVVKQGWNCCFFSASAPFQERALTQNLTWFIPGKIPANGNSSQRKDKEEFREVEQNLEALRHGEVSC